MKKDNRYFAQILSSLNSKVNRRSSYIHNITLKYHSGDFSHDRVISNLKSELYMQTPRNYIPYDAKTRESGDLTIVNARSRRSIDTTSSIAMPLQASLVKFHLKSIKRTPNRPTLISKKTSAAKTTSRTHDANYNTE